MKRLLFITPGFPKTTDETHVVPFVQQFIRNFHERFPEVQLTVVSIHKPVSEPYSWHGIEVVPLNGNDIRYPSKFLFLFQSFLQLRKLHRERKFDGVLNFWFQEFSILTRWLGCQNYTWFQGQDVLKDNRTLQFFRPKPNHIIALSDFQNQKLFETMRIRANKVIPIGIDEKIFPKLNQRERQIDIMGAGWLTEIKNFSLFIGIVIELRKTNPDIRAVIAGTGNQERQLKQLVRDNGIEKNVSFLGLLSHAETLERMNDSKIFLHTATFEGGGAVCSEALYSGCQFIATLPLFDRKMENFHLLSEKSEIVAKIRALLNHMPAPKRIRYYAMETVCDKVYQLFY